MSEYQGEARQTGRGHDLFVGDRMHSHRLRGFDGWCIPIMLTSYRSLPLSCIDALEIAVDGQAVGREEVHLLLGNQAFAPGEFGPRSDVWWFILDTAEVWFPAHYAATGSQHDVTGKLIKVEPYISNGRWHFTSTCTRTFQVVPDDEWKPIPA